MKQLFKLLPLCVAATVILACNKETPFQDQDSPVKTVKFSTTPYTKTVFGTQLGSSLPTLWTDSYNVAISLNLASYKKSSTPVVSAGGSKASFTADIEDDSSADYNFYAVSPYDAVNGVNAGYQSILINIPTAQTPTASSPDELAQILYSDYAAGSTFPTSVTMTFSHLSAYGKIGEIKNLALSGGETVQSISLTAVENWAGRYYYYVDSGDITENSASSTITITTSSTTDIWFGCAPVDLGGKTVDVVITTNLGTFSKTITIPAGKKFESGKVGVFNIDMNGISRVTPVNYIRVTDVADLTLGSEVIIVAKEYDLAMSTTQNGNNRAQAGVTKSGNTISSPGADVQVFTIENGNKAGTYAFYTGSQYIYAASSSSNYLRSENVLSNNSSWYISIAGDGEATIKAVGTNTRNILQYNSSSSVFSCYGTASQAAVAIYKKDGTGSGAIDAKEAESMTISGATTAYSVGDTYSFDGTVSILFSDTSEETIASSEYTVDASAVNMSAAGSYTVTVSYNAKPSVNSSYTITVTGGGSGTTVTYSFAFATMGSTGWSNSYADHDAVYDDAVVTIDIKSASKQGSTITDYPVTKAGDVIVKLKGGKTMSAVTFTLTQWTTKAKEVSLQYSTDGGTSFNALSPAVISSSFSLTSSSLPSGTNAVKMVQGNTGNQVGLVSVQFTYE